MTDGFPELVRHRSASDHDAEALRAVLANLRARLVPASWGERSRWRGVLSVISEHHIAAGSAWDPLFAIGELSAELGFWGDAAGCFERSLAHYGPHVATLHNLAMSQWQLGRLGEAARSLERGSRLASSHARLRELRAALARYTAEHAARIGEAGRDGDGLRLVLMAPHHAPALVDHHRDAAIARRIRQPRLTSLASARAWIETERREGSLPMIVVHPTFGPVGVVGIARGPGGDVGIHYWIRNGLRGRGYGRRALALARRVAAARGIPRLVAYVDGFNLASARALSSAGFREERAPAAIERAFRVDCLAASEVPC